MKLSELAPWKRDEARMQRYEGDPFVAFRQEMNRLMEGFFEDMWMPSLWREERLTTFTPRIDVTDNDTELVVTAELPGVDPQDVEITVTGNALTLKGEKKSEREEKDEGRNYYRLERSYGAFSRQIQLPPDVVDVDQVDASYHNGVLTIRLPKLAPAQSVVKKIEVKTA